MNNKFRASRRPRHAFGIAVVVCLSCLFSGCTSTQFRSAAQGANLPAEVRVGDQVNCQMSDGTQKAFVVTAVEPATLVGENLRVPIADIQSIEVTRFDGTKTIKETAKFVGGVVLVTGVIALCLVAHGFPITSFR